MIITLDKTYYARVDSPLLGYIGETESRTITAQGYQTEGADRYILRLSYADGKQYDVDITSGTYNVQASLLRAVGNVKCQLLAVKSTSADTYEYVKKSNIFTATIKPSVGGDEPVPTYEETVAALEKVLAAEIAADECISARDTAVTAAGTATEKAAVAVDKATEAAKSAEISAENASQTAADRAAVETAKVDVLSARDTAVSAADKATENAQTAINNAVTANTAAEIAVQANNAAQTAKTTAEQAATAAEESKSAAETAAQNAGSAATTATEQATAAQTSAESASSSENTAATSATNAASSATAAQLAQTAAQTAKTTAETAQGVAESKAAEIAESASKIADLEAVSHTHDNKTVLDKFNADTNDNLTYDNHVIMDLDKFFTLQRTGKVYGVKVYKATANPTSVCEKTRDNAGLVCEPSTDTVEGRDDYADIPLFKWYEVNYKRYDDGFAYPTAFIGDSNYKTDNVDIGAMQMTFYYSWIDDNEEYRELVISDSPNEALGLKPWELAVRADGTVMPYFIQSRYHSVLGSDGLLHSMRGKIARNQSHDGMITGYQKKGTGYWGAGSNRFTFGQIFNLIKYANKSSQDTMQGVTSWDIQYPASVQSEEMHNYFPVTNAQAANLQVGLCVSVGYANAANSLDRGVAEIHKYADDVKITAIETLDDDNKAVYLDCEPFNTMPIVTNDLTRQIYMSSMHAHSGDADCVIGHHDGSPVSNTDGKHPCRIQGVEYLLGAGVIASDTVMYFNEDYSKDVYYAPRGVAHSKTDSVIKSTYTNVGTIPANTDGKGSDWWSGDIVQTGGAWYPINQVSSSGYGNKDICGAGGATTSGSREYYQGGALWHGSVAGLCFLRCWNGLSWVLWFCAAAD